MRTMGYETFTIICYIAAAISVVLALVGVFLFFKLRIKNVIGDLTGINRKKSIENIKAQNKNNTRKATASTSMASKKGSSTNLQNKTNTKPRTESNMKVSSSRNAASGKISNTAQTPKAVNSVNKGLDISQKQEYETSVLGIQETYEDDNATSVLGVQEMYEDDNVTSVLGVQKMQEDDNVTSVLGVQADERKNETSILSSSESEDGIIFIHGETLK